MAQLVASPVAAMHAMTPPFTPGQNRYLCADPHQREKIVQKGWGIENLNTTKKATLTAACTAALTLSHLLGNHVRPQRI